MGLGEVEKWPWLGTVSHQEGVSAAIRPGVMTARAPECLVYSAVRTSTEVKSAEGRGEEERGVKSVISSYMCH